jgi:Polyketide cyclase / dehydrase and lipid transport
MFATRHIGISGAATRTGCFLCLLLTLASLAPAGADTLSRLEISENSGSYRVRMVMLIHAPAQYVHGVLTDYTHIYRLNPLITESQVIPSPRNGSVRVKTRMEGCIFFFCRNVDRVEEVREVNSGHLQAVIIPEQSDFTSGSADWRIQPVGDDTQVIYEARMTPAFFIPPVIGSYFVKRTFAEILMTSFARLECIARIRAELAIRSRQSLADARSGGQDVDAMQAAVLAGDDPSAHGQARRAGAGQGTHTTGCAGICDLRGGGC